jgi:enoyl-[acyl-carrier protein] reductase I
MDFLRLKDRKIVIFGVANRKSVAFHIGRVLEEAGAEPIFSVRNEEAAAVVRRFFPGRDVILCDFSDDASMQRCAAEIAARHGSIYGVVHSVAFADYSEGMKAFHDTPRQGFLEAMDISCYSFIRLGGLLEPYLENGGAMLTISISTTRMAAESYGYMAPVKAALDSSVCFLAKSLSGKKIRVNAVGAALLKTSASAGIPGYIKPYLFAEKATLRKEALKTEEVADAAAYLLSPRASGINAQTVVVDAGLATNLFDREIVDRAVE